MSSPTAGAWVLWRYPAEWPRRRTGGAGHLTAILHRSGGRPLRAALGRRFGSHRFRYRTERRPRLRRQDLCGLRSARSRRPTCGTLSAAYRDHRYEAAQLQPARVDLHGQYGSPAAGSPRSVQRLPRCPNIARPGTPGPGMPPRSSTPTSPCAAGMCRAACGYPPRRVPCRQGIRPCWDNMPSL